MYFTRLMTLKKKLLLRHQATVCQNLDQPTGGDMAASSHFNMQRPGPDESDRDLRNASITHLVNSSSWLSLNIRIGEKRHIHI